MANPVAVLLPNGRQQFLDNNGNPLAGGSVSFYVPATFTAKLTWQDAAHTVPNSSPTVTLDAAGEALIYGIGTYRQILKDALGNQIWDAQTFGLGGDVFGGTSTGSANAQVGAASNFSAQDGQFATFIAGFTNSGPMTYNAGVGGAQAVVNDTTTGPIALVGGEVTAGNFVLLSWDATLGKYHLLSNDFRLAAATAAQFWANSSSGYVSPTVLWAAGAEVALVDAATVALDLSTGINFSVTLAGNRALGAASNGKPGQTGRIAVTQDATGTRTLSYGAGYKFAGGVAPVLTTTAGAVDFLYYDVKAANFIAISALKDVK